MNNLAEKRAKQVDKLIFFWKRQKFIFYSQKENTARFTATTANVGLYNFWDSYIVYYQGL